MKRIATLKKTICCFAAERRQLLGGVEGRASPSPVCAAPKGMVFAPFWSESGYRLCPFWSGIGCGFRGNYGSV